MTRQSENSRQDNDYWINVLYVRRVPHPFYAAGVFGSLEVEGSPYEAQQGRESRRARRARIAGPAVLVFLDYHEPDVGSRAPDLQFSVIE